MTHPPLEKSAFPAAIRRLLVGVPVLYMLLVWEEALSMPYFAAAHGELYPAWFMAAFPQPAGTACFTWVVYGYALVGSLMAWGLVAWVRSHPDKASVLGIFSLLPGVILVSSLQHLAVSLALQGYSPGVVTALLGGFPVSLYMIKLIVHYNGGKLPYIPARWFVFSIALYFLTLGISWGLSLGLAHLLG